MSTTPSTVKDQLIRKIDALSQAQQETVLNYVEQLARPIGASSDEMLAFVGTIAADDLALMEVAIEDCEQIDLDGW